jgi:preprotein translocase subunit YajC
MPPESSVNPIIHLIPPIAIFLIFYFLLIKPQKEQQQKQKAMLSQVKKNDQVVTTAGIHGTVVNVKDTTVVIRIDDNARMEVNKDSLASVKAG